MESKLEPKRKYQSALTMISTEHLKPLEKTDDAQKIGCKPNNEKTNQPHPAELIHRMIAEIKKL